MTITPIKNAHKTAPCHRSVQHHLPSTALEIAIADEIRRYMKRRYKGITHIQVEFGTYESAGCIQVLQNGAGYYDSFRIDLDGTLRIGRADRSQTYGIAKWTAIAKIEK